MHIVFCSMYRCAQRVCVCVCVCVLGGGVCVSVCLCVHPHPWHICIEALIHVSDDVYNLREQTCVYTIMNP